MSVNPDAPEEPRPWRSDAWWLWDRLEEAVYQAVSWPYFIALSMTALFVYTVFTPTLHSQTGVTSMMAITSWGLAFARREFAKWVETRKS